MQRLYQHHLLCVVLITVDFLSDGRHGQHLPVVIDQQLRLLTGAHGFEKLERALLVRLSEGGKKHLRHDVASCLPDVVPVAGFSSKAALTL